MVERFVNSTGTISVANGATTVTGTGTTFAGRDREGAWVVALPDGSGPMLVGIVAAVDPRGVYENLELPLVAAYNGSALTGVEFLLVDGLAVANGASQAAIYARFAAFLDQNMGLVGNTADDIDYSLVPNNSLFVDAVTRTIYQWRNGVLDEVSVVATPFTPRGQWEGGSPTITYAENDLIEHDGYVFISNEDDNVDNEPVTDPSPASDEHWTYLPLPSGAGDIFALSIFIQGRPSSGELVLRFVFVDTITFPASLTGSEGHAKTAATAETEFSFTKIGTGEIWTGTFAAEGDEATFEADSEVVFTAGQILEITAPATSDDTLADISLTLRGTR